MKVKPFLLAAAVLTLALNMACLWAIEDIIYNNNVGRPRSDAELQRDVVKYATFGLSGLAHSDGVVPSHIGLRRQGGYATPAPGYRWLNPSDPRDFRVVPVDAVSCKKYR